MALSVLYEDTDFLKSGGRKQKLLQLLFFCALCIFYYQRRGLPWLHIPRVEDLISCCSLFPVWTTVRQNTILLSANSTITSPLPSRCRRAPYLETASSCFSHFLPTTVSSFRCPIMKRFYLALAFFVVVMGMHTGVHGSAGCKCGDAHGGDVELKEFLACICFEEMSEKVNLEPVIRGEKAHPCLGYTFRCLHVAAKVLNDKNRIVHAVAAANRCRIRMFNTTEIQTEHKSRWHPTKDYYFSIGNIYVARSL